MAFLNLQLSPVRPEARSSGGSPSASLALQTSAPLLYTMTIISFVSVSSMMQLSKWKRGIEEKDLVIKDLEYKLAAAKQSRDEYMVRGTSLIDDRRSLLSQLRSPSC